MLGNFQRREADAAERSSPWSAGRHTPYAVFMAASARIPLS
ncbi:hypothetical protein BURPS668_3500 [Burkholderia pseudomallei 668]|nr:hypothetical protein BURPS668_3500 [Burkholderia pseudomallei 668]